MTPSVRSRLTAGITAFVLGFVVANYGIFRVPPPDQWLWVAAAAMFMLTSAWAVVVADSQRPISVWAVLGAELCLLFFLIPLIWIFTLAVTPDHLAADSLLPETVDWSVFGTVWDNDTITDAGLSSLVVALGATGLAVLPALGLAWTLARTRLRGRRVLHASVVLVMLAPVVIVTVAFDDLSVSLGLADTRWGLILGHLVVTVPLLTWVFTTVVRAAPWNLVDAARADGAHRGTLAAKVLLPSIGPGLVAGVLLVCVVAGQDLVMGTTLSATDATRTLSGTLFDLRDEPGAARLTAATGLMQMLPVVVVLAVFPRRITHLLGRSYR